MQKISIKQKIILIIFGLFLCVVLLEIGLRIGGFVLLSLQEYRNRISIQQRGTYRIMCLGESTTAVGGKDSYPNQLQEVLNKRDIGIKFRVINKGIPGTNTGIIVSQLEDNLNKYTPDMIITMMGENDSGDTIAYRNVPVRKTTLFIKLFRTYKLIKLLRPHIVNKAREIGIYKEKEDIKAGTDNLTQLGNFKGREEMFKKAIELNPENDGAYIELGWDYNDQAEYNKAEEMFQRVIETNSKNNEVCVGLGWWYRSQGKYDRAEEMFKRVIETNPKNSQAYSGLGWCYRDQGKYDKAEEMFKKSPEINPYDSDAYFELGWCYRSQGKYEQAEEIFKRAIEIDPKNDKLYNELAICYEEQGKNKSAEECFSKANKLKLRTYNPITRHNYQRLKEIVTQRGIRLVCVQYPIRGIEPLKKMFNSPKGIIFVDNERVFKEALKHGRYDEYFEDMSAGDFGHCTSKGNRLLAENIADVILKECFKKELNDD